MAINKLIINELIEEKKKRLAKQLEEFKEYIKNQGNYAEYTMDAFNVSSNATRHAIDMAKIEGQITVLQEVMTMLED